MSSKSIKDDGETIVMPSEDQDELQLVITTWAWLDRKTCGKMGCSNGNVLLVIIGHGCGYPNAFNCNSPAWVLSHLCVDSYRWLC